MDSIDKNDVDISKLFIWKGKLDIIDEKKETIMSVYIRLAGDADTNRARTYAIRESGKFRRMLKSDSEDRMAYLLPMDLVDRAILINLIKSLSIRDISNEAIKDTKISLPREPEDDSDLSELEEYQQKVDDYPKERFEKIQAFVASKLEILEKELEPLTDDELYTKYENLMIDTLCETKMVDGFKDYSVFLCTYKDAGYKHKLFSEFDEFDNLPIDIKAQFREFYMGLELGISDLKK